MILRISDRYIIRSFLFSFVICFAMLLALFMVIDSFAQLGDLVSRVRKSGESLYTLPAMVLRMNAVRTPLIFYELVPVLTLAAAMFTIARLRRANEITPLLASGVSMHRILWPIFLMAIAITVVQVADRELVIPRFGQVLYDWDRIRNESTKQRRNHAMMEDSLGNVIFASTYNIPQKRQDGAHMTRYWPGQSRSPMIILNAQEARWIDAPRSGWLYVRGTAIQYDRDGGVLRQRAFGEEGYLVPLVREKSVLPEFDLGTDATPARLETEEVDIFYRPTLYLLEYVHQHGMRTDIALDVNRRIAAPLTNLVLLLIGLPFALKRDVKNPFLGVAIAVAITGAYYAIGLICENFALQGRVLTPLTGAWAPIIIFGPIGVLLFDTIES